MPTYEYECTNGHQFEVEQRITDEPLRRCTTCRARAHRLISATSFILKGVGWCSDGYSSASGNGNGGSKPRAAARGPSSDGAGSSESKSSEDGAKSSSAQTSSSSA